MSYKTLTAGSVPTSNSQALAIEVLVGLSETPKRLASRLFYDDEGSRLFQAITELDEYYLTRSELEIFKESGPELLGHLAGQSLNVVDLGAGDGHKTAVLLDHLRGIGADVRYVPIDISEGAMRTLTESMQRDRPDLEIAGLVSEYFEGIRWLAHESGRNNLVLFLGSNIGNFDRAHARGFLRQLWNALGPGDYVLLGFDLKKDIEALLNAYADPHGVTSAFNLNLLHRLNRELGANFDLDQFRHYGTYNARTGAMESYLVSLVRQTVRIEALQCQFEFQPWEPIHTEYSYKYLESDIESLAAYTGFRILDRRFDPKHWFCSTLWAVEKAG